MSRAEIARLRAAAAALRATAGGGSWLRAMRQGPPPTLAQLAALPGPLTARFPKPGRRPPVSASLMEHALHQGRAWRRARAEAGDQARAEGRDPAEAMRNVGELGDFGVTLPPWAREPAPASSRPSAGPAPAREAPKPPSPRPERAVVPPRYQGGDDEGEMKVECFLAVERRAGRLPPAAS